MNLIKKWFAAIFTSLLVVVLFGAIFIALDLVDPSPAFGTQTAIITLLVIFVRIFWYNSGEDKASEKIEIIQVQKNYSSLVSESIDSQESLEKFLEKLNKQNRDNWVKQKLGNKTPANCKKYQKLKDRYDRWSGFLVKPITSTQLLTRSERYAVLTAKDFKRKNKYIYQTMSFFSSFMTTLLTSAIAFNSVSFSWPNIFKFTTYLFTIVWAMMSSYSTGYKNHIKEVTDHISRLTMIVNRYNEWQKKEFSADDRQS